MKKFFILISLLMTLSLLCTGLASASSTTPYLEAKTPKDDVYLEVESPVMTYKTELYSTVLDDCGDCYRLLTYTNTLVSDIDIGNTPIDSMCVFDNYAILCTSNGTLIVYDVTSKDEISITGLPSNVYSISLSGTTLYAQMATISAYDLTDIANGNVTLKTTYDSSDLFKVQYGIVANDQTVYYTKKSVNLSSIFAYDTTNNTSSKVWEVEYLADFEIDGGKIYALTSETDDILRYDITTESEDSFQLVHSSPVDICVRSSELAVTHKGENTIDLYDLSGATPVYKTSLCSSSDLPGRFDSPSDVYNRDNIMAVADYGNDRVQLITESGISSLAVDDPVSVATYAKETIVASINAIYVYDKNYTVTTYTNADGLSFSGLTDLTVDNNGIIYAIDKNNARIVKKAPEDTHFKTYLPSAPLSIAIAPKGTVVYCVYSNVIRAYDSGARLIFETADIPTVTSATADVDSQGNMYLIHDTTLFRYTRSFTGYTLLDTTDLNIEGSGVRRITVSEDGEILMLDGVRHQVFEIKNSGAVAYTPTSPDDSVYQKSTLNEAVNFAHVNADSFIYDNAENYETTRIVKANTTLILLSTNTVDGFYYVYCDGPAYIPTSNVTINVADNIAYNALALHENTSLYKYPILDDAFKLLSVDKDATFTVVTNTCNFSEDNKTYWSQIVYNGNIYYVTRNNIGLAPAERVVDYGWAKLHTSVMGQKVKVYSLPDDKSGVIDEYADGTEVKLLDEIDSASSFTQVQIGDQIGYVKTSELTTGGMTTAQIVILVLILLGGTASVTVLVISRKMHRRDA